MLKGLTENESLRLLSSWEESIKNNNVYGFGLSRLMYWPAPLLPQKDSELYLRGIFDNNKAIQGQTILGYKILDPAAIPSLIKNKAKIVIFSGSYEEIKQQLLQFDLKEKEDFIFVETFWSLFSFYKYNKLFCGGITNLQITSKCNLRCRHCGVMMPYFDQVDDLPLDEIALAAKRFFEVIDQIQDLTLGAGEARLHGDFNRILKFIGQNYGNRIVNFFIATNGTGSLSAERIDICRQYQIRHVISDYSGAGIPGYENNLKKLIESLKENRLPYYLIQSEWYDVYPSHKLLETLSSFDDKRMSSYYATCAVECGVIHNSRFYPCLYSLLGEMRGLIEPETESSGDWLDLKTINKGRYEDRLKTLMYLLSYHPGGYARFCRQCKSMNTIVYKNDGEKVPKAAQLPPDFKPENKPPCSGD